MSDLLKRHESVLAPVISFATDIEVQSADGAWVTDSEGETYLDFACGISVTNLGHRHPQVVEAVNRQLERFWHAGGVFHYDSVVEAAERLEAVTPPGIEKFLFMNSGAEAVEAAVKMARKTTGRQGVVAFRGGFHGRTMGSVTYTTAKAGYREGYHPLVGSVFVAPFPHPYRWGMTQDQAVAHCLDELDRILRHEITPGEVAAFLVEPIQGEGGYYPAGRELLTALRSLADQHGILLIHDEVQTGFGRTGDWFTSQVYGVTPDVMCFGKAIANGLPLSAMGASAHILDKWLPGSHGTTFGGNPVAAAAAAATIDALADVVPGVADLSEHSFTRLRGLAHHPSVGDVRGLGLMIGVELVDGEGKADHQAFDAVQQHALSQGLLLIDCGPEGNVIRFIPPLIVTRDEIDRAVGIIDEGLTAYESR